MGITDWKQLTVAHNENFKTTCQKEKDSRFYWVQKWGWLSKDIIDVHLALMELKFEREKRRERLELKQDKEESEERIIFQDPCPFPDTTNHEYGWLHQYPDWNVERFGPFPLYPVKPKTTFKQEEIDAMIEQKKQERRERWRKLLKGIDN